LNLHDFTAATSFTVPFCIDVCFHARQLRKPYPIRIHTFQTDIFPSTTQVVPNNTPHLEQSK